MAPPSFDTASILSHSTSHGAARSIYPRGPQFAIDTFTSKDFIARDFVEALSDGAAQASRRSGAYAQSFDPKPFIRTFEHALTRLGQLSDEQEARESEASGAVRKAEAQHKQHCAHLQNKLDQALEAFNSLEDRLESSADTSVNHHNGPGHDGGVAVRIGERLDELARQKRRAEDARFLIQCWQDVNETGELLALEDRKRLGGSDAKIRCAHIARSLLEICNRLDPEDPNTPVNPNRLTNGTTGPNGVNGVSTPRMSSSGRKNNAAKEAIEKFLERLEKELLTQFDDCYAERNLEGMRDCSTALYDFGEGASVIGRYVNQHEYFLNEAQANMAAESSMDNEAMDRLADPDNEPVGIEPSLQALVDDVKLVLEEESFIIRRAFSFHEQVLTTFVQRIFQQSLQQRLESVLGRASAVSSLAFLRTLKAARSYIGGMVEDLKAHGLTEHPDPLPTRVATILDQQLEDLFIPYIAGGSYGEREVRNVEELYSSLLVKFTVFHSRKRKPQTTTTGTYLSSLGQRGRDMLVSAKDRYLERLESSDLPASQKKVLLRIAGLKDQKPEEMKTEIEVTDEDGIVSLPMVKRMLQWLAESVGRGLELSAGAENTKDVASLQTLLLHQMGEIYIETALDAANDKAVQQENVRAVPDLGFMTELQTTVSAVHLMLTSVNTMLLPLAATNLSVRRHMERQRNMASVQMEDKIDAIRQRSIDVALNWVSKLLARQNKADFRPKDEAINIEQIQTPTCLSIFTFLAKVRDLSVKAFGGRNLETYFTELASGLRSLLLEHFTKFQVNLAGGLMVSKDITKYIELIRTFHLAPSFQLSLEILLEIGNLFVIGPEALKDRLRGGSALAGVDKQDLQPYILRRDDVNSIGVQTVLNAL